jgi:hypothetical protein
LSRQRVMRRALPTGLIALVATALIAPAAQGATRIRQVQVPIGSSTATPAGTLTLQFVFKNRPQTKRKFTPRRLILIDFSKVPLICSNESGEGTSQLLFDSTMDVSVKLTKAPPPNTNKPKPGRYAFRFTYSFPTFSGSVRGTIDKPNRGPRPRLPRSQGSLRIDDLDANPGHTNCSTQGPRQWGGLPLTGV